MASLLADYKYALNGFSPNTRLMLTYNAVNAISNGIVGVLFNLYFLRLGLDESFLGSTVLIQGLVVAFAGLPFGMLADRLPKQKLVKLAFVMLNVFFTALMFSKDPAVLLTLYAMNCLGLAVASASEFAYLCENVAPESRTHLFSINMAVFTAGPAVGMAIGGYLPRIAGLLFSLDPDGASSYRLGLCFAAALYWVAGLAVMRLGASPAIEKRPAGPVSLKFSRPAVVLGLCANAAFVALGASMFSPFMNVILSERFHLPAHLIGWLFTVQSVVISLGALMVPKFGEKRGNLAGLCLLQIITIPMYLLLAFAGSLPVFALAYILRGTIANMASPLFDSYSASAISSTERGSAFAMLNLARNVMWAVGGKIGGTLLGQNLFSLPILLASVSYALGAAVVVWMTRSPKTREAPAAKAAVAVEETAR